MKKKLLIVNKAQFGYHTDSFKYCQYLKDEYDVTYICFDTKREKIEEEGVTVVYVPYEGSFLQRGLGFVKFSRNYIKKNKIDLIFVVYFQMASFLTFGWASKVFILDIRTGAIGTTPQKRKIDDTLMVWESKAFKYVTVISECLRDKLGVNAKKSHILPLGADVLSTTNKVFEQMKLLYVGTFLSRNMHETVFGFSKFIQNHPSEKLKIVYDIFGFGTAEEEALVKQAIVQTGLEEIVIYHGRKTHQEIQEYYDTYNIGVTYVPKVDFFECQPPTKIFEYTNAGLYNIATSTFENKKLISQNNGVVCEDNVDSFAEALEEIYIKKESFSSQNIRKTLEEYSWENIVSKNLKKYFKDILNV